MVSGCSKDGVFVLYQWDEAESLLLNSYYLVEYTLLPNVLQHLMSPYAHILAFDVDGVTVSGGAIFLGLTLHRTGKWKF
jgi:hypothetical protein